MRSLVKKKQLVAFAAVLAGALATACGSDTPAAAPATPSATPTPRVEITTTVAPELEAAATPAPRPERTAGPQVIEAGPFTWTISDVDTGAKPALALTSDGVPHIAYMLEAMPGFVKTAVLNGGSWDISTIAEGYFYGPLDIGIGPDHRPHVTYHDHQANTFQQNKGDAVHAVFTGSGWEVESVFDVGHDGWDNRLVVDAQGRVHMSAIDPEQFGGIGVEYYFQDDAGEWQVESIGSGPQTYQFAASIAVNPQGVPHITYFEQSKNDLVLASRTDGEWTMEIVDGEGDAGLFSALVIGADGRFHVSYLLRGETFGAVKYATRGPDDAEWELAEIDRLTDVKYGFTGARNITSIALDSDGRPSIAYSDEKQLKLAIWDGSRWESATLVEAGDKPFGQLVSLAIGL